MTIEYNGSRTFDINCYRQRTLVTSLNWEFNLSLKSTTLNSHKKKINLKLKLCYTDGTHIDVLFEKKFPNDFFWSQSNKSFKTIYTFHIYFPVKPMCTIFSDDCEILLWWVFYLVSLKINSRLEYRKNYRTINYYFSKSYKGRLYESAWRNFCLSPGDSNVGDIVMLVTLWWWLISDVGWQNHYVGDFFRYVGDFFNVSNRSPTSWIGHQHLKLVTNTFDLQHPSPTSM